MRLPHVRVTVRLMMLLVAAVALGLAIADEFRDGIPPRFVVRGISARIERLRVGMTWEQTREILGLGKSWLIGGTSARFGGGDGGLHHMHEVYYLRRPRTVVWIAQLRGGDPAPVSVLQSTAMIQLWFRTDFRPGMENWRRDTSTRLVRASFSNDSTTIAEMRGSQ